MSHWSAVPLVDRFWPKVAVAGPDDCWIWQAATMTRGYGKIYFKGRLIGAHRASWILAHGDPGKLFVLHRCDNPPCVNPAHLWLGTNADNHADKRDKGRQIKGADIYGSKLSDGAALAIIADRRLHREIAVDYGICRTQVSQIKTGRAWEHLHSGAK